MRRAVYRLRRGLAAITMASGEPLQRDRIRACGFAVAPAATDVAIVKSAETGRCRYDGLITCGSVWECPACARAIKAKRADEVKAAIERHGAKRTVLVTLTVRHGWGDDLKRLRSQLADAWRGLTRGAPWRRFCERLRLRGTIRALEVTHGPNGFHPHLHVLLLIGEEPPDREILRCAECRARGVQCGAEACGEWAPSWRGWLLDRWRAMVARYVDPWARCTNCAAEYTQADAKRIKGHCPCGRHLDAPLPPDERPLWLFWGLRHVDTHSQRGRHMPSEAHALSVRPAHVAEYISKLGLELSDPGVKQAHGDHRSPFEIAADCLERGSYADRRIWRAYCDGMRGARQLTWSRGLKAALRIRERTDLELAPDEEPSANDVVLARVSRDTWHKIRVARVGGMPADFYLLVRLEQQGASVLRQALADIERARHRRPRQGVKNVRRRDVDA